MMQVAVTCVNIFYQDWVPKKWELWLVYNAFNIFFLLALKFGTRLLPFLNGIGSEFDLKIYRVPENTNAV